VFSGLSVLGAGEGPARPPAAPGDPIGPSPQVVDDRAGVICDRRARTYTAVLALRGHTFALLGPEDKDRRVAGWAAVLASLAREGSVVHRLQWVASALPDDGRAVRGHLEDRSSLPAEAPARQSYAELLAVAGVHTCRHEVLLAVQVMAGGRAARAIRAGGGGDAGACAVLLREVATLRRLLAEADVTVEGLLSPAEVAGVLRRTADPGPGGPRPADGCPPCPVGWPWPVAVESEWSRLRTDATWHTTYWVAEWPRIDVGPDFLAPLLLSPGRRSLSVVMEPLSPLAATRAVERARTADLADSELRRRGGFLSTARRHRESELVVRREEELADGHAAVRYSGYVTVTAPNLDQLEDGCETTEQAAGQARLELRRLYGDQERAFLCTLPLGRGLS
jgi:hypothetical protein